MKERLDTQTLSQYIAGRLTVIVYWYVSIRTATAEQVVKRRELFGRPSPSGGGDADQEEGYGRQRG